MKNFLTLLGFILCSASAFAQYFEAENEQGEVIYYLMRSGIECAVTSPQERDAADYYKGDLIIPAQVEYDGHTLKVVEILHGAFRNCSELTSVTIPETVTTIIDDAFQGGCPKLTRLNFSSIEALCNITFWGSTPMNWDANLYLNGQLVEDVVIPEGTTEILGFGLRYFNLKSIKLPTSLTTLYGELSADCLDFASMEHLFSMKVNNADYYSFPFGKDHKICIDGQELKELVIPEYVKSVPDFIFSGATNLQSVTFHEGVKRIGLSSFRNCTSLTHLDLPQSLTSIDSHAFDLCSGLQGTLSLPYVQSLGWYAFGNCTSLSAAEIPAVRGSLNAFNGCTNLRKIWIGKYVDTISPLQGCPVEYLRVDATTPPVVGSIYGSYDLLDRDENSGYYNATLEVPAGCKSQYMAVTPWNRFNEIIESAEAEGPVQYCETPVISYEDGQLYFKSSTPGAVYHYSISMADQCDGEIAANGIVNLAATYFIKAYVTATGFQPSKISSATLCWLGAEPELNSLPLVTETNPVLVKVQGDMLLVEGAVGLNRIEFYATDGRYLGAEAVNGGHAAFQTTEPVVIVKMAGKTIKVAM